MPTDDTAACLDGDLGLPLRPGAAPAYAAAEAQDDTVPVPAYLRETYTWAYLSPLGRRVFDHPVVVSAILWGNIGRLIRATCAEIPAGSRVLQTACVYGDFSIRLAEAVGTDGSLEVIDVAPIQVEHCRNKLTGFPNATVLRRDAAAPGRGVFDAACAFFLLHEVPEAYKADIVHAVLGSVAPGGKAVFVDYHPPARLHPLRPVMSLIFRLLEPYATALWRREIASYAGSLASGFEWRKETYFGGLYQKVVAVRKSA